MKDESLETFAEMLSDWFWETDADHRFVYFSRQIETTVGVDPRKDGYPSRLEIAARSQDKALWEPHLADLDARRPFRDFVYSYAHKDGSCTWVRISGMPVFDDEGRFVGYRGVGSDVTAEVEARRAAQAAKAELEAKIAELSEANFRLRFENDLRKALEAKLVLLARTDPLTGLLNRRAFFEAGDVEFARHKRAGSAAPPVVIMLDIDHFKSINDRFGHSTGDRVLEGLARVINEFTRKTDVAARIGGEEFALILLPTDPGHSGVVIERIRPAFASLAGTLALDATSLTLSCGVTVMASDDASFAASLERADTALYRAKRNGRDRVETCLAA